MKWFWKNKNLEIDVEIKRDGPEFIYYGGVDPIDKLAKEKLSAITMYIKKGDETLYSSCKNTFEELVEDINKQNLGIKAILVDDEK